jgi:hypothetical protein
MLIETLHCLNATQAARQLIPHYLTLNYDGLFKIQRVRNAFTLNPVSFSSLASYLECPGCAMDQRRKRRAKEPKNFSNVHQVSMFGRSAPDPQLLGTLQHALVNFLHDASGPVPETVREHVLADTDMLTSFIQEDLLDVLQVSGKLKLAMFYDELRQDKNTLHRTLITPLLHYQHELARTGSTVLSASERFQFKLMSTRNTFMDHPDWGGSVGIVGEFDQIRLRRCSTSSHQGSRPAIMEFKKDLGKRKTSDLFSEEEEQQPSASHAMQLMVYWLAFQTRWDLMEKVASVKGRLTEIQMPMQQELDLILFNLHDGCQYQLIPSEPQESLVSLINSIFYLDWAMKSSYVWQSPEHECRKTAFLADAPNCAIQVGYSAITAQECYMLARQSFERFKSTIHWHKISGS